MCAHVYNGEFLKKYIFEKTPCIVTCQLEVHGWACFTHVNLQCACGSTHICKVEQKLKG
jgi:hypothetical protein